jgi:hypothetical protein
VTYCRRIHIDKWGNNITMSLHTTIHIGYIWSVTFIMWHSANKRIFQDLRAPRTHARTHARTHTHTHTHQWRYQWGSSGFWQHTDLYAQDHTVWQSKRPPSTSSLLDHMALQPTSTPQAIKNFIFVTRQIWSACS